MTNNKPLPESPPPIYPPGLADTCQQGLPACVSVCVSDSPIDRLTGANTQAPPVGQTNTARREVTIIWAGSERLNQAALLGLIESDGH